MIKFGYSARDKDGKLVEGVIEHVDQNEALATLQANGLVVISIAVQKKRFGTKPLVKKLKNRLNTDDLALFCRQLATLLNAGVTLLRSLSIVLKQTDSRSLYQTIDRIRADVEEGHSLRDAVVKHPKIFSPLWVSLIETGEASGQLAATFEHLAAYLERSGTVLRKVKSAMVYPAILLFVCIVAILIFTMRIIPMFSEIYKGFNIELPALTMLVLKFSNFMRRYILFAIAAVVFLVILLKNVVIKTQTGRYIFDALKLKIPLTGPLVQSLAIERFAHALSTLIRSGSPLLSALHIVGNACDNKVFRNVIEAAAEDVRAGKSMCDPIEASGLFPVMVSQMIKVGEETGKLGEMLDRVAIYYQERMNAIVDRLTAAFEPLLLIFMGATIGTLVVAMYLPIFKIATGGVTQ
jgi:type IV pilus assembly protein PilC